MKTRQGFTPVEVAIILLLIAIVVITAVGYFAIQNLSWDSSESINNAEESTCVTYLSKTGGFRGGPQDCDRTVKKWCIDLNNNSQIDTGTECGAETLYDHFQENIEGDT